MENSEVAADGTRSEINNDSITSSERKTETAGSSVVGSASSEDLCPLCSKPGITSCRSCKKISYCSKIHQRQHWKSHKPECFPLVQHHDKILGSRLIATRNIKAGEIILRESPLVVGGRAGTSAAASLTCSNHISQANDQKKAICFGCFSLVKSDYLLQEEQPDEQKQQPHRCASCFWPACSSQCLQQRSAEHLQLECKIFTSHKVEPKVYLSGESELSSSGMAIMILRGVLLKSQDPSGWAKILSLHEMRAAEDVDQPQLSPSVTNFCYEFVMKFKPPLVTKSDIDLMLRVLVCSRTFDLSLGHSANLLLRDADSDTCENVSVLYFTANQASQNCVPNTSWTIDDDWKIQLRALTSIQFGRTISLCYVNEMDGTVDRQQAHFDSFGSMCTCDRCKDPEEKTTFYSAIKCDKEDGKGGGSCNEEDHNNSQGWLIPTVYDIVETSGNGDEENCEKLRLSWKPKTTWSCKQCYEVVESKLCQELVEKSREAMRRIIEGLGDNPEEIMKTLQRQELGHLHNNHYSRLQFDLEILKKVSGLLQKTSLLYFNPAWIYTVIEFLHACRRWLDVAEKLWPGLTRIRGLLLFYLQQGMTVQLLLKITYLMRDGKFTASSKTSSEDGTNSEDIEKDFLNILSIRKEVLQIFCREPQNSQGYALANAMANSSPEIEVLKRYAFTTRNGITAAATSQDK